MVIQSRKLKALCFQLDHFPVLAWCGMSGNKQPGFRGGKAGSGKKGWDERKMEG